MRVFVTGASGAIGTRLIPKLVERGHVVIGATTSPAKATLVRTLGATPVVLDVLDTDAVRRAIIDAQPDAIVHQATALANLKFSRGLDTGFAQTNRLRTEGTDTLLAAAKEAGVPRFVAQSYAPLRYARTGGPVKDEDDPLEQDPLPGSRQTHDAMLHLDEAVMAAGGIALRYGSFYGAANDTLPALIRKRQLPIVGNGGGISPFIHLEDAAAATVLALDYDGSGIFNIVDDDPAPMREWVPYLAQVLGAKPPRHVPPWLARLFAGDIAVLMGTEARGASNAKAKREFGWQPQYPSWRQGFIAAYGQNDDVMRIGHLRAA